MTWMSYTVAQFRLSQLVYWKRIGLALVAVLVPLGLGIALPLHAMGSGPVEGISSGVFMLTGFLAFPLFFTAYSLVQATTSRRDALIYKRLRTAPLPDSSIFVGEGLSAAIPSLVVVIILITFGFLVIDTPVPHNVALLIVGVLLGVAMFAMLGIGVSGILPRSEISMLIVAPVMILFMFCSGVYVPVSALPRPVAEVAVYLPMTPVVNIIRTAYLGQDFATRDALLALVTPGAPVGLLGAFRAAVGDICIIAAWTAIGFALAIKKFRWNPRRSS